MPRCRRIAFVTALLAAGLPACGQELQINLVLNNPCNQAVLAQSDYITLTVESPDLDAPQTSTFTGSERSGELGNLPAVRGATLTVLGQDAGSSGGPAPTALAAVTVAGLNLDGEGESNPLELNLMLGLVGQFARTTDAETHCSAMTIDRRGHSATLLADGRVLIVGGERVTSASERSLLKSTEFYNPRLGNFVRGPDLPGGARKDHTATRLPDGRVLIAGGTGLRTSGGITAEDTLKSALLFDPASDSFEPSIIVLAAARANHSATLLPDGSVLLAGGSYRSGTVTDYHPTVEFWDPAANPTGTRTIAGVELSVPRGYHQAVAIPDGGVVFIGGRNRVQVHRTIDIYRGGALQASPQQLNAPRLHFQATLVPAHNTVLISGGFQDLVEVPPFNGALDSMELYRLPDSANPAGVVSCGTTLLMAEARGFHQAAARPDGRVLITGGIGDSGKPVQAAELVTLQDVASCAAPSQPADGPLSVDRAFHVLSPLPGGDLLVTGGTRNNEASSSLISEASAEVYVVPR